MIRRAVFPGSFDPFTIGHESIVRRSLGLFDEIIVAVGKNTTKATMYSVERRVDSIRNVFKDEKAIRVEWYNGLTVAYCKEANARFILRGLRTSSDFGFERAIGQVNKAMEPSIETVFILALPEHSAISSTIIRDIIKNGGDARRFVPEGVEI